MAGNYFLGIPVPDYVAQGLEQFQARIPNGSWEFTHPKNFHVTLKFLGKDLSNLEAFTSRFEGPYSLSLCSFGTFKQGVLFAKGTACSGMQNLAGPTWIPHVTLAKGRGVNQHLGIFDGEMLEPVRIPVHEINLYRTVGAGQPYEKIESWNA